MEENETPLEEAKSKEKGRGKGGRRGTRRYQEYL